MEFIGRVAARRIAIGHGKQTHTKVTNVTKVFKLGVIGSRPVWTTFIILLRDLCVRILSHFMKIGLVRRGFSRTGGAESYLKRFGRALADGGHRATLYSTQDWPQAEWLYGNLVRSETSSPLRFAQTVQECRQPDEILFSLDRVLQCDCYRAGDGLHKLWLERRVRA